jgi:hypothetical protein
MDDSGQMPLNRNQRWFFDATVDRYSGFNFSSRGESEVLTEYSSVLQNVTLHRSWQNSLRLYPGKWIRRLSPFIFEFNHQPRWDGYLQNRSEGLGFIEKSIRILNGWNSSFSEASQFYQFRGEWRPSASFWYYTSLDWNKVRTQRMDSRLDTRVRMFNQKVEIRPASNVVVIVQYIRNEENKGTVSRWVRDNPFLWIENR